MIWKQRKNKCFVGIVKILNNSQNTIFTQWSATLLKETPTQVFFDEISEIFKSTFSDGTPPVVASDIDKSFLVLDIISFV